MEICTMQGYVKFWRVAALTAFQLLLITAKNQKSGKYVTPQIIPTPSNVSVSRGDLAVLQCAVNNLGTKTVIWRKLPYKHPLTIGLYTFIEDPSISVDRNERTNQWDLLIRNVQPHHAGLYECQISSIDKVTHIVQLRVKDTDVSAHPDIHITGTAYVQNKEPIKLLCNVTNRFPSSREIMWYKDGEIITSDITNRMKITRNHVSSKFLLSNLIISNSHPQDSGIYVCRSSDLEVARFKVHILNSYEEVHVRVKDPVKLICNTSGEKGPPEDIQWFKQGTPLSTDTHRKLYITNYRPQSPTLISVFTALESTYGDTGVYVCTESGKELKRFKVDVLPVQPSTATGNVDKREPPDHHVNTSKPNVHYAGRKNYAHVLSPSAALIFIVHTVWRHAALS